MPEMIAVKPADGLSVRNPDRAYRLLKAEGELVPGNAFWLRRIATKDVVEISADAWKKLEADKLQVARDAEDAAAKAAKAEAETKAAEKVEAEKMPSASAP